MITVFRHGKVVISHAVVQGRRAAHHASTRHPIKKKKFFHDEKRAEIQKGNFEPSENIYEEVNDRSEEDLNLQTLCSNGNLTGAGSQNLESDSSDFLMQNTSRRKRDVSMNTDQTTTSGDILVMSR